MHNFISLTRVLNKCNLGTYAMTKNRKSSSFSNAGIGRIILYVIVVFLCLGLAIGTGLISYAVSSEVQDKELLASVGAFVFLVVQLFFLITSVPKILGAFFLSSDIEAYLPLPIKPTTLILAKLCTVVPYAYIFTIVVPLPLMIGATIAYNGTILNYLLIAVMTLILPIIPLSAISLISILLMHICKNVKKKENIVTAITYGLSFLMVIWYIYMNYISNNGTSSDIDMTSHQNLMMLNSSVSWCGWVFPSNMLAAYSVVLGDFMYGLLAVLVAGASFAIFMLVANKFYFGAVSGINEGSSSRKKSIGINNFKRSSVKNAFKLRERKSLFRSTIYVIQCFIWPLLTPMIFLIGIVTSILRYPRIVDSFFAKEYSSENFHFVIIGALVCAFMAVGVAMMNKVTSTCVSREGKSFFDMRAMPIPYKTQVQVKAHFGLSVALIMSVPFSLVISLILVIGGGVHWSVVLFSLILSISLIVIVNDIQLFTEARKPKLYWDNEEAVMKELRGRISGLIAFGLLIIYSVITFLTIMYGISDYIVLTVLCIITVAIAIIMHKIIMKHSVKCIETFSE